MKVCPNCYTEIVEKDCNLCEPCSYREIKGRELGNFDDIKKERKKSFENFGLKKVVKKCGGVFFE